MSNGSEHRDLILRCKNGDGDAFSELLRVYTPLINRAVADMSGDGEFHTEACIALYKAALSYDLDQQKVTFGLYARICIVRRLLDLSRSRAHSLDMLNDTDVDSIAVSDGIISRLEAKEDIDKLCDVARELLSEYEYGIFLMWLGGCGTGEIASRYARSPKSVDNAKSRIVKKLRTGLAPEQKN